MPKEAKKRGKKTVKKTTKKSPKSIKKVSKNSTSSTKKKSVKKSVEKSVKKAAKKKTKKVSTITKVRNAPQGKEFFLVNGKKVKNYEQLARIMEDLEDQVFHHHVNPTKNDFSNWVRDVFNDIELAKKIAGVSKKDHLELVLYRKIVRGK